jgi:hypothetical protein
MMVRKVHYMERYPHSFVQLLGYIRACFHLPYRQTEGVAVRAHACKEITSIPDYSTINRRINQLNIKINCFRER